jgi:hypothetical protein
MAGPSSGLPQVQTVSQAHRSFYLHEDGLFGPVEERECFLGVLDLMRRGFDLEVRWAAKGLALAGLPARAASGGLSGWRVLGLPLGRPRSQQQVAFQEVVAAGAEEAEQAAICGPLRQAQAAAARCTTSPCGVQRCRRCCWRHGRAARRPQSPPAIPNPQSPPPAPRPRPRPCRFRAVKNGSARRDVEEKLAKFSFPLLREQEGGCRPIELPGGRRPDAFPVVHKDLHFAFMDACRRRSL